MSQLSCVWRRLSFAITFSVILVSLTMIPSFSVADTILYDTTNLSIGLGTIVFTSPSNQLGNEIMLAGTTPVAQLITEFDLFYQGFVPLPGQELSGQGTVTLRLWTADATPSLLYQSAAFPILSGSLGIQELDINDLQVVVPRTFIWTAQFGGIDSGYNTPGALAPVSGTVVGTELSTWLGPGSGSPSLFNTNYIFESTIKGTPRGVPEPSSLLLLTSGIVMVGRFLRKRSITARSGSGQL